MIAAVLHLYISARAGAEPVDQMPRGIAHRHDVIHADFLCLADKICTKALPNLRLHFFAVAQNRANAIHRGKALRVNLGGAAGYHNF